MSNQPADDWYETLQRPFWLASVDLLALGHKGGWSDSFQAPSPTGEQQLTLAAVSKLRPARLGQDDAAQALLALCERRAPGRSGGRT